MPFTTLEIKIQHGVRTEAAVEVYRNRTAKPMKFKGSEVVVDPDSLSLRIENAIKGILREQVYGADTCDPITPNKGCWECPADKGGKCESLCPIPF